MNKNNKNNSNNNDIFSYVYKGEEGERVPTATTKVTFHPSATIIPNNAFCDCSSLTTINIANTIVVIGYTAFKECTSLTNIHVPNSVQQIGTQAFYKCTSLTSIKLPQGITIIPDGAFGGCSSLTNIEIPNTVVEIGDAAFGECSSLTNVNIPNSVQKIGRCAFSYCTSLTSVTLPHGITIIPGYAFNLCSSLATINIPNTVVDIDQHAFYACTSLTKINIPNSVQKIGIDAFRGCENMSNMKLPPNLNNFPECLFSGLQFADITNGPGPQHDFKGSTQCNYGPQQCGINLDQIKQLKTHPSIDSYTKMRDVVKDVIKPATKNCGIGYALMVNQNKPLHAKVMVSHAWDETFDDFVTSLERSGHKGPFWVCALSIYQSDGDHDLPTIADQLGPDPDYGPFATVLKGADMMMAVITDGCDIYSRLWCVYELHTARRLNKRVELRPFIGDDDERDGNMENDICVSKISTVIDCKHAFCWDNYDKERIHEAITKEASDGFKDVNQAVELIRLEYLLKYPVRNIMGGEKWSDMRLTFCTAILILVYATIVIMPFWPLRGIIFAFGGGVAIGILSCIRMANEKWDLAEQWLLWMMLLAIPILAIAVLVASFYFHFSIFGIGFCTPITLLIAFIFINDDIDNFLLIGQRVVVTAIQIITDGEARLKREKAADKLSKAVEAVYTRVGDTSSSEIVSFDTFCESNVLRRTLYGRFPLMAYYTWTRHVTRQLNKMKKASD